MNPTKLRGDDIRRRSVGARDGRPRVHDRTDCVCHEPERLTPTWTHPMIAGRDALSRYLKRTAALALLLALTPAAAAAQQGRLATGNWLVDWWASGDIRGPQATARRKSDVQFVAFHPQLGRFVTNHLEDCTVTGGCSSTRQERSATLVRPRFSGISPRHCERRGTPRRRDQRRSRLASHSSSTACSTSSCPASGITAWRTAYRPLGCRPAVLHDLNGGTAASNLIGVNAPPSLPECSGFYARSRATKS